MLVAFTIYVVFAIAVPPLAMTIGASDAAIIGICLVNAALAICVCAWVRNVIRLYAEASATESA
jgi:hypothetical protein